MPPPRFWEGSRIAVAWLAGIASFAVLRWTLARGVVRGVLEGGEVEQLGGVWTAEFATLLTVLIGGVLVVVLGWLTGSWVAGRGERAANRRHSASGGRRILM